MAKRETLSTPFDRELAEMPPAMRWREWMGRIEAVIFASAEPVPRETLAPLVGKDCVLDDLIGDIREELKGRPFDLVFAAGGFQHRTRSRFADAIRVASKAPKGEQERDQKEKDQAEPGNGSTPDQALTKLELIALAGIAYQQPATRSALSEAMGRDISRDILARLKRIGLITGGPRAPFPGAPLTYVTTAKFLSVFGLATLRDLPEIDGVGPSAGNQSDQERNTGWWAGGFSGVFLEAMDREDDGPDVDQTEDLDKTQDMGDRREL
jgi:segregation and condensation protein B